MDDSCGTGFDVTMLAIECPGHKVNRSYGQGDRTDQSRWVK
jgi:ketol-acid reductoisomerase